MAGGDGTPAMGKRHKKFGPRFLAVEQEDTLVGLVGQWAPVGFCLVPLPGPTDSALAVASVPTTCRTRDAPLGSFATRFVQFRFFRHEDGLKLLTTMFWGINIHMTWI